MLLQSTSQVSGSMFPRVTCPLQESLFPSQTALLPVPVCMHGIHIFCSTVHTHWLKKLHFIICLFPLDKKFQTSPVSIKEKKNNHFRCRNRTVFILFSFSLKKVCTFSCSSECLAVILNLFSDIGTVCTHSRSTAVRKDFFSESIIIFGLLWLAVHS